MFNVGRTLLINSENQKKYHYIILLLALLFIQKSAATTYYVNDNNIKDDTYTTAVGNDSNEGISPANPKLTIKAAYEMAQDGDTIIVDTGSYSDLSEKGKLLFIVDKKVTFTIAGVPNPIFSKIPIKKGDKATNAVFYVDKDKPVDRQTYLLKMQNDKTKKSE